MKRRYVIKRKCRFALLVAAMVMLLTLLFSTVIANSAYGYKERAYKVVRVYKGDTLWEIAGKYNKGDDIRRYIYEIKKVNNLSNSEIHIGEYLLIPHN